MKNLVTFIITLIITVVIGMTVNAASVSAAEVSTTENIQPLKYITVLNKDQLTAIKDIDRYYGDAYWKALGRGEYADGTKVIINTEESIYIGLAWNHSIENIIVNYHNDCEHSMRWHCEF